MSEDPAQYGNPISEARNRLERAFRVKFDRDTLSGMEEQLLDMGAQRVAAGEEFQWTGTTDSPTLLFNKTQEYDEPTRWILAREACCRLGLSQKEASDKYGLSYEALRKKCQREEWPIMSRVKEQLADVVPTVSQNRILAKEAAENWSEKAELARSLAWRITHKPLEAIASGARMAPKVETWADVATAIKLNRQAVGLDTAETQVNASFNFAMLGQAGPDAIPGEFVVGEAEGVLEKGDLPE